MIYHLTGFCFSREIQKFIISEQEEMLRKTEVMRKEEEWRKNDELYKLQELRKAVRA